MKTELISEINLAQQDKLQIAHLLKMCFPDEDFKGQHYFKQLPGYRILLKTNNQLIGQLGLDYRVMSLNDQPINVVGLIDLAVLPDYQGKGMAKMLMKALNDFVNQNIDQIDFLLLSSERHDFYRKFGFEVTAQRVKWVVTENHMTYDVRQELIDDSLMFKQIGIKKWSDNGRLDMMGYWY